MALKVRNISKRFLFVYFINCPLQSLCDMYHLNVRSYSYRNKAISMGRLQEAMIAVSYDKMPSGGIVPGHVYWWDHREACRDIGNQQWCDGFLDIPILVWALYSCIDGKALSKAGTIYSRVYSRRRQRWLLWLSMRIQRWTKTPFCSFYAIHILKERNINGNKLIIFGHLSGKMKLEWIFSIVWLDLKRCPHQFASRETLVLNEAAHISDIEDVFGYFF